jgi:uncharacterized DUF497 family protein
MFVYDLAKSRSNRLKHGIDFAEAQKLWEDPRLLERRARTEDELRYRLTGRIGKTVWTAIVTYRGDLIRIISVRRARNDERKAYFGG